jgi:hypothetical protein
LVIFGEQGIFGDEKLVIAISQGLPPFSARADEEAEALLHQRCLSIAHIGSPNCARWIGQRLEL